MKLLDDTLLHLGSSLVGEGHRLYALEGWSVIVG